MDTLGPIETRSEDENDALAQATSAVEELRSAAEQRHTAHQTEVRGLNDRIASLETRLNRPGGTQTETRNEPTIEQRAFGNFLRHGQTNLTAEEQRALTVGVDANGGYTVPDNFVAELLRDVVNFSPVRQYARVMSVAGANVRMPKRTGNMTAQWVAEIGDRPETQPTYGEVELTPFEAACWVPVSNQLLEDSAFDLEAELRFDASEEFGRLEGVAFVSGDGVGKPKGILTEASIATITSGNASTLGTGPADKLVDLYYALNPAYRRNGTWAMNSKSLAAIRKLKDTQGNFLWSPGITAGQPETILGRPVIDLPDMPDVGANALPIIFGDFAQGYRIVDRVQLQVLRDPYTLATKGQTRFHFRRRVGGGVVKAEAFKALKIAV
ncbi:phage major capsid protein [Antarcticirhabdus aurantiaca]|uniref:Phage major capsid protein n=1 Tax=Antarcticirhabdus aurantiaca TaxID=2606717 RepID=A0ACD4NHP5_9HYPH|nr:phage major capsid protein [Jeongeuplla avenae]